MDTLGFLLQKHKSHKVSNIFATVRTNIANNNIRLFAFLIAFRNSLLYCLVYLYIVAVHSVICDNTE